MDFKSFKLVQTDMTAQHRVYEEYKTENGVHLEYYISTEMWDDKLVRQIIECVVVESKEKIKVVFIGGTEIEMVL